MFYKITIFSFLLFLGCGGALFFSLMRPNPADLADYAKLIDESLELRSQSALERRPARQLRKEVQKDIWTINNHQRLHYRLKSQGSDLTIRQKKGKVEAIEELQEIECCMQEEINGNEEQIRYLVASEGTYSFPSHRFVAEDADLYFFSLPGTELPPLWPTEAPFLRGHAHEVVFSAAEGLPSFTAYHLNAELDTAQ